MVPNLDAMAPVDLMAFWFDMSRPVRKEVELMFDGRPKGYTGVAKDLANYASNKATSMECRLRGDIQTALGYEQICDRIYDRLPEYARW